MILPPSTATTTGACTAAERAKAAEILAACAAKPIRRVTTEYLRAQPAHAQAYGKATWAEQVAARRRAARERKEAQR
jgi:hypothetical protein